MPANPPAWLLTAARRRAVDRLRAEAVAVRKEPLDRDLTVETLADLWLHALYR